MGAMSMDSHLLLVLLVAVCVLCSTPALAQTVQVWSSCSAANYTPGSAYDTNLRGMLKDVVGVAVRSHDGYANDAKGDARGQVAHGLAICYADARPEVCRLCLDMAAGNVTLACPRAVGAAMMYNNCLLRYANASFLARPDMEQRFSFYNNNMTSAGDADQYSAALRRLMDRLGPAAAASPGRMSAFGETNITADKTLYGFAQCVADLSTDDCRRCLQSLAASLPMTQGGRAYSLTCYTRFEVVPFYMPPNTTRLVVAPESSSEAPPPLLLAAESRGHRAESWRDTVDRTRRRWR